MRLSLGRFIIAVSMLVGLLPSGAMHAAESARAIFVPVPREPSWQEFVYLAAVPAAQKLQPGTPAVVALDRFGTLTPEVNDWISRYKPTALHITEGASSAESRPRIDVESKLVQTWLPRGAAIRTAAGSATNAQPSAGESVALKPLEQGPFTVAAWLRFAERRGGSERLITFGDPDKSGWSLGLTGQGTARFEVVRADDSIVETCTGIQTTLTESEWHHVAGVVDETGTMKLYVDGRVRFFLSLGTQAKAPSGFIAISKGSAAQAEVDEVRIFARALSERDLATLAERPQTLPAYGIPGAKDIKGADAATAAASLSQLAWDRSERVVLTDGTRYDDALLASSVAAKLNAPLMYMAADGSLPPATKAELDRLQTRELVVVGAAQPAASDRSSTFLADAPAAAAWLKRQGLACDYLAVANARDREIGMVRKASLAAALLAAARGGLVVPLDYETQWHAQLWSDGPKTERPAGAVEGVRNWGKNEAWTRNAALPKLTANFKTPIYPARGVFAKRDFGGYNPKLALVATKPDADAADRVLIDVNGDSQFGPQEVFAVGDRFTLPARSPAFHSTWPITLRITAIRNDDKLPTVELAWNTWLTGRGLIGKRERAFVITSRHGFGFDTLQLDLNDDGRFDGPGEGPLGTTDVVQVDGLEWAASVAHYYGHHSPGHAALTHPSPRAVKNDIERVQTALGRHARYLCFVGLYDSIPFGATVEPVTHAQETPSDFYYANIDADPFQDLATGRVVGESTLDVTLLATRTVTYDRLWDPSWGKRVLATGDWAEDSREHTLRLQNAGFLAATEPAENYRNGDLTDRAVVVHAQHACNWGWGYGPTMDIDALLAPTFADGAKGCMTVGLDLTRPNRSPRSPHPQPGQWVSTLMLRKGAVAVLGNTRPASGFNNTAHAVFWDSMIEGKSVGESMRDGLNCAVYTSQHGGLPFAAAAHQVELLGDPAWKLRVPVTSDKLPTQPARVEADGAKLTVVGPQSWWPVKESTGRYRQFAPGAHPEYNVLGHVLARWTTSDKIVSLRQRTETPKPLGWTGKWMVDEHEDGTRTLYWRVRMIDQDGKTGDIRDRIDRLEFTVETTPHVAP